MLAHIRNGALIRTFSGSKGWFQLEGGGWVSPPVEGFVDGNDKIVPVVEETTGVPVSATTKTTVTRTVEADRYLIAQHTVEKTTEELATEKTALVLSQADQVLGKALFKLMNDTHPNAPFTKQQFINWLEANA